MVGPDERDVVLFDCNDAYVAERFTADHGIRHIAAVVVSHLDLDHVRGFLPFVRNFLDGGGTIDSIHVGHDRPDLHQSGAELVARVIEWDRAGTVACPVPEASSSR